MRIGQIKLSNFKSFEALSIDLGGQSTVLAGINGAGKSTILSAIAYVMHVWLKRLNPSQGRTFETIPEDCITCGKEQLVLSCEVELGGESYLLQRERKLLAANKRRGGHALSSGAYDALVSQFGQQYLSQGGRDMPIFVHYGVNRSVIDLTLKAPDDAYRDQVAALARATDNTTSFRLFFDWFRDEEADEAIAIREQTGYQSWKLNYVREVIADVIDGIEELHVRRNPLRLSAIKNGQEMRVEMLSDGEKCTLALFGDLVRRLVLANPGLDNPLEGEGVVLIDEIELHLHPSWQRRILGLLRRHFPNVQFVVSTHSPQVLGEADDSYNIYFIESDTQKVRRVERLDLYDANLILEDYMGTPAQNPLLGTKQEEIFRLVDAGDFERARHLLEELEKLTGNLNKDFILARNYYLRGVHHHETHR